MQQIEEKLNDLILQFGIFESKFSENNKRIFIMHDQNQKSINKLTKLMEGNGGVGYKEQQNINTRDIYGLKGNMSTVRKHVWTVATGVVIALITFYLIKG